MKSGLLLLGFLITLCTDGTEAVKCDPEKYEFYRYQTPNECGKCDECIVGEGKLTLQESGITLDPVEGSRQCIPCRPCKDGLFSNTRSDDCKVCTNCTTLHKETIEPCTKVSDAECGGPIPSSTTPEPVATSKEIEKEIPDDFWSNNTELLSGVISGIIVLILVLCIVVVVYKLRINKETKNKVHLHSDEEAQNPDSRSPLMNNQDVSTKDEISIKPEIPSELKFVRPKDYSPASSSDDEQKSLLKPARTKRRMSFPGRQTLRRNSILKSETKQNLDLRVDSDNRADESCKHHLKRLMSYPLDQDQTLLNTQVRDTEQKRENTSSGLRATKHTKKEQQYSCSCTGASRDKPSKLDCFKRHLGKLLIVENLYKTFGDNYLTESTLREVLDYYIRESTRERSYQVVERVFQVKPKLTKSDVFTFLNKHGREKDTQILQKVHL